MNPPPADPPDSAAPLVTVITAFAGNPLFARTLASVAAQQWPRVQHLVLADGPAHHAQAEALLAGAPGATPGTTLERDLVALPYAIGTDGFHGHRIYGAGTFMARGEFLAFLDDDNAIAPGHIASCMEVLRAGRAWTYALRNIVDRQHRFICRDDCESLGRWPSILGPTDFMIDVNCYFLPRRLALQVGPLWFRRFRDPGQLEADRAICQALHRIAPDFDCTYRYTVDYQAGNTPNSVQPEFFLAGNERMLRHHGGQLPWARPPAA